MPVGSGCVKASLQTVSSQVDGRGEHSFIVPNVEGVRTPEQLAISLVFKWKVLAKVLTLYINIYMQLHSLYGLDHVQFKATLG